jgi:ribonuclease-3
VARAGHRGRNASGNSAADRAPAADLAEFEVVIGHRFNDPALLSTGLRHSSLGGRGADAKRFDRFEFLGDRVIGLVVAELLLSAFPDDAEGDIARRHARLVNRDSLARLARAVDLGRYLELSPGEAQSGGRENPAVLADAFEAVIATLYLDGGLEPARHFLAAQFAPLMLEVAVPPRDAKTALQEWAQGRGLSLPSYRTIKVSGPAHRPKIVVEVRIDGLEPESAEGPSRRAAEQAAAAALFARAQDQR